MINSKEFFNLLQENDVNFYTGVPDSLLKDVCAYITDNTHKKNNIIAINEGAAVGLATGYHLATGKVPIVYMQNSGLGNAINPLLSLADEKVYKVPMLLMIGWRGEPNVKDEPQHVKQGEVTLSLLEVMQIPYIVIDKEESIGLKQLQTIIDKTKKENIPHAIVVRKRVFSPYKLQVKVENSYSMTREEAMKLVVNSLSDDNIVVSTTGKLSRELYEYRKELQKGHEKDFLTVGSMGHASSIALGIALKKPNRKIYCFDGDGSVLMHTGALATIGHLSPKNFIHILFNNGAHESVGGQPTIGFDIDFLKIAEGSCYKNKIRVQTEGELKEILKNLSFNIGSTFLEICVGINSRVNLGRPNTTPAENKIQFMNFLND